MVIFMEQSNGMKKFREWLNETKRLYEIAFEHVYMISKEDDLDSMLFDAMRNRDEAEHMLRRHIATFVEETYSELVRDFINAKEIRENPKYDRFLNDFHIFLRSYGHSRPFVFRKIDWREVQMTETELYSYYQNLQKEFQNEFVISQRKRFPISESQWENELTLWGAHIKCEVLNDGFDGNVIGKKLADLIGSVAVLTSILGYES